MARPADRMRLKDRVIDNISKAIKSIQELVYYQYKDPLLTGYDEGVVLYNNNHLCHKLCENLDHTLLHGLKNVMRGYWRVVKQLSPPVMVKEIDLLINVTTDLGKGRAWLYASLNEGLLESYIRLLCDNDKLLKKYYAKEALILDRDRMSVLLTLASGLDCVTFHLEYDVPYLDLNAYPPRSRSNSEQEADISSDSSDSNLGHPSHYRSKSEVYADSPGPASRRTSDSDSVSLASLDAQFHSDVFHMKISTISTDSGFPGDCVSANGSRQHSVTLTSSETAMNNKPWSQTPSDSASLSSVGSLGDLDKLQRLENVVFPWGHVHETDHLLEVIHMTNKKGNGSKSKRKKAERLSSDKSIQISQSANSHSDSQSENPGQDNKFVNSCLSEGENKSNIENVADSTKSANSEVISNDICGDDLRRNLPGVPEVVLKSIAKCDSGVDICSQAAPAEKCSTSSSHTPDISDLISAFSVTDKASVASESSPVWTYSEPAVIQTDNKKAEISYLDAAADSSSSLELNSMKIKCDFFPLGISDVPDCINQLSEQSPSTDLSGSTEYLSYMSANLLQNLKEDDTLMCDQNEACVHISDCDKQVELRSERHMELERNPTEKLIESTCQGEEDYDVYSGCEPEASRDYHSHLKSCEVEEEMCATQTVSSQFQDNKYSCILQTSNSLSVDRHKQETQARDADLSLKLDNNTVLQLMLDVFTREDEQFLKMFVTCENHTEGGSAVSFLLISDQCLYILHYQQELMKFVRRSFTALTNIIFISTGLNGQTLNIESRGKNKEKHKLWLTPGNQRLSQAILTCLADAVKTSNEHSSVKSRFSVGSEVPLQKIALRKYISSELNCKPQDVTLEDYTLVFWEDLSSGNTNSATSMYKEGTLHLKIQDALKGHTWKPVYVMLKNSMLFIKNDKHDLRPRCYLSLGGDQCVGCRLTSCAGRDNCMELILSHGDSWLLSAASETEISEWRYSLCLAVSQGNLEGNTLTSCIPCCVVVSCNQLFLCHEDLYSRFYRTLGKALLDNVAGIAVDYMDPTYCVIVFNSQKAGKPGDQWVLYFYSAEDMERHQVAVTAAWKDVYKAELPVYPVEDIALQCYCRTNSHQLRQKLTLS